MIKWRLNIYNLFFLFSDILFYVKCQNKIKDEHKQENKNFYNYTLETGISELKYLNETNRNPIQFSEEINDDLLINFYSPSCDIKLDDVNKQNVTILISSLNAISMKIKNNAFNTSDIIIAQEINFINGRKKYNNKRICPFIVNTIKVKTFTLIIKEKEPTFIYFHKNLTKIILLYNIIELKEKSSVTLSFSFREVTIFNINIPNLINTNITNSTTTFLDSDSLSKIKGNILNITITHIYNFENKNCSLIFQIIEPNSIYVFQKDYLNKGFITSNYLYQYYYMQILEEEGEIMLHNKRNTGKLFGVIKKGTIDPYNISEYSKEENDNELEFYEHTQKLSFNYKHTRDCKKGCYLLITFYNENNDIYNPIIGYEFTLLARVWDVEEYSIQIINIPLNEFIFGTFEDEYSLIEHYYSFFIPNETKKLIIQIDSNCIKGYIGKGKKKLIPSDKYNINLNLTDDKMIIEFPKNNLKQFKFLNDEISLVLKPEIFSKDDVYFYYFRISILTENDANLIYNLDSNIGNICLPEKDVNIIDNYYYCYFLFNEFNLNFYVASSEKNENYKIYYFHNNIEKQNNYTKYYKSDEKDKDLKFILFKFEFNDNGTKTILSTFSNELNLIYPQIYSFQIYRFYNSVKTFNFKAKYISIYKHIYGNEIIKLDNYKLKKIVTGNNFKGKSISIPVSEIENITFYCKNELIFYYKLDYLQRNKNIKEIVYGESMKEFLFDKYFPIYYYIKYNNQDNIDINFRILNIEEKTTKFLINGYLLNTKKMERKKRGEFIALKNPIQGKYDKYFKNGLLQINGEIINNIKKNKMEYILIKIDEEEHYTNEPISISIEIIAISKESKNYILPINQFIMGSLNLFNNINYIIKNDNDIDDDEMIIEFSTNYEDIKLIFNDSMKTYKQEVNSTTGIQKYRIKNNFHSFNLIVKAPQKLSDGNYILRYYFINESQEFTYKFDKFSYKKSSKIINKEHMDISFEFNKFEIYLNNILINGHNQTKEIKKNIKLQIYGFLFKDGNNNKELLDTSAIISSIPSYESQTEVEYKKDTKFTLYFNNILTTFYKYNMQIKINVKIYDYYLNEQFLVYTRNCSFK